jgi:hypothetical protein
MDRDFLLAHLAEAQRHVAEGAARIGRQRQLIIELGRDGHSSDAAEDLLRSFERIQKSHLAHRDRIREELDLPLL